MNEPTIDDLEVELTQTLGRWAISSMAMGAVVKLVGEVAESPFLKGFAGQQLSWGAIDGAIAGFGTWRRQQSIDQHLTDEQAQEKADKLKKLLVINAALDVGYVAAGIATMIAAGPLSRRTGKPTTHWLGLGAGVAVQGGFLWALDATFARRISQTPAIRTNPWHDSSHSDSDSDSDSDNG
jgi:hypothetical protein